MDQSPTAAVSSHSSQPSSQGPSSSTLPIIESPVIAKSLNYNLPIKLTRDNYVHWKALVLPAIRALELEDFINGVRLCPDKFVANPDPTDKEKDMVINSDFLAWRRLDQFLLVWLLSTVSENLIGEVTECSSALEAWRTLDESFAQQSLARVMQLRQQLGSTKKGSSSVAEFVLKIKGIGDNLRSAGDKVSDRDLLLSVVNGVGHEFDAVVVHITSQRSAISLHEAQYLLMLHEQRIEHLNTAAQVDVKPSANFVANNYNNTNGGRGGNSRGNGNFGGRNGGNRGRRGRGNWNNNNNNRPSCQICGRIGHVASRCYNRFDRNFQSPTSGNTNNNANNSGQTQSNFQGHQGSHQATNPHDTNFSPQALIPCEKS